MNSNPLPFIDAAFVVLNAAEKPLHYREIAQHVLEQGLVQTDGKTPEATINAVLAVDIKQKAKQSRFVRIKPGVFALRDQTMSSRNLRNHSIPLNGSKFPIFRFTQNYALLRSQITGLRASICAL